MKTVYQVVPVSEECREWLWENVDTSLALGNTVCVEHGFIGGVVEGLVDAGFVQGEDFNVV
jgi:hypothetical protein